MNFIVGAYYITLDHRYRKSLNRLLKVCYVPATSAILIAFFSSFFAAAINSTNEANKAASKRHWAVLDVYALNSNCEAKSASKNLKNIVEDRVRSQI